MSELTKLQDAVPPGPWEPIREQIVSELGRPIRSVFASLDKEPIAAASLAQVHAETLHDEADVVVKVQRPGIAELIEVDLEILQDVARLVKGRVPLTRIYDFPQIARGFATTLRAELDFYREAHNADRFGKNFADNPHSYVPDVSWNFTTRRVLVMERISGIKIDSVEALDRAGYDRHQVAFHAAEMVLKEVLEDATPGAFRHHLHLPSELWLLGKTLAMMEGVALRLDPSFDSIEFSRPRVRRFYLQMLLPRNLGSRLMKMGSDWTDLFGLLPRIGSQLLIQAERGEFGVTLEHKGLGKALDRLDRSTNRISLSLLLAALILGLALLIPAFKLGQEIGLATIVVIVGFVGVSLLGLWLAFSIWRSRR